MSCLDHDPHCAGSDRGLEGTPCWPRRDLVNSQELLGYTVILIAQERIGVSSTRPQNDIDQGLQPFGAMGQVLASQLHYRPPMPSGRGEGGTRWLLMSEDRAGEGGRKKAYL